MLSVSCPTCLQTYQIEASLQGRAVRCRCGAAFTVPASFENAEEAPQIETEAFRPIKTRRRPSLRPIPSLLAKLTWIRGAVAAGVVFGGFLLATGFWGFAQSLLGFAVTMAILGVLIIVFACIQTIYEAQRESPEKLFLYLFVPVISLAFVWRRRRRLRGVVVNAAIGFGFLLLAIPITFLGSVFYNQKPMATFPKQQVVSGSFPLTSADPIEGEIQAVQLDASGRSVGILTTKRFYALALRKPERDSWQATLDRPARRIYFADIFECALVDDKGVWTLRQSFGSHPYHPLFLGVENPTRVSHVTSLLGTVAVGTDEGVTYKHDGKTKRLTTFRTCSMLRLSAKGPRLSWGTRDGVTLIVDLKTGNEICRLPVNAPRDAWFSEPDAKYYSPDRVVVVANDGASVWDCQTGQLLSRFGPPDLQHVRLDRYGFQVAASNRNSVFVWDVQSGDEIWNERICPGNAIEISLAGHIYASSLIAVWYEKPPTRVEDIHIWTIAGQEFHERYAAYFNASLEEMNQARRK